MRTPIRPSTVLAAFALFATLPATAEVIDIDQQALRALVDEGVPVVDIRRPDEWRETGVIEGSHLLTFFDADGEHDARAWKAALDRIVGADEPVVLLCRSGRRTAIMSEWLGGEAGHGTVYDVDGGIASWLRAGGEVAQP